MRGLTVLERKDQFMPRAVETAHSARTIVPHTQSLELLGKLSCWQPPLKREFRGRRVQGRRLQIVLAGSRLRKALWRTSGWAKMDIKKDAVVVCAALKRHVLVRAAMWPSETVRQTTQKVIKVVVS